MNKQQRIRVFMATQRAREVLVRKHGQSIRTLLRRDRAAVVKAVRSGGSWKKAINGNLSRWRGAIKTVYVDTWLTFGRRLWRATSRYRKAASDDEWVSPAVEERDAYLQDHVADRVRGISTSTREAVGREISAGTTAGRSTQEISDRIAKLNVFGSIRAETIARNEIAIASNHGSRSAALQTGLPMKKEWITIGDERVRGKAKPTKKKRKKPAKVGSNHRAMSGKIVKLDTTWKVPRKDGQSPDEMMFPMDDSLGARPDSVINCRCVEGYIVT